MTPVFILHCHYNGLSLIQALGRRGVPVIAIDSQRNIGTRSRYAEYIKVSDPLKNEEQFINDLLNAAEGQKRQPLLIPTNDGWAEALAKSASRLEGKFLICNPDLPTINLLLDKESFGVWARSMNLLVPTITSAMDCRNNIDGVIFPISVKANSRRRAGRDANDAKFSIKADALRFRPCNDKKELISCLDEAKNSAIPVFCQEIVNGQSNAMRTIGVYARNGEIKGLIFGRKIRGFPAAYGDCIVGQAEPVPPWAEDLAVKICGTLDYTGICEIEIMEDSKTKENFLIEVNPRSWSWVGIGPLAGVDLAWLAYSDFCLGEKKLEMQKSCADSTPVRYVKILQDLQNCIFWYRITGAKNWSTSLLTLIKEYRGKKTVFAEFNKDDPLISFYACIEAARMLASRAFKALKKKEIA